MLGLPLQGLMLAQASEWDCRNWIREYDQLSAQIQYQSSGQAFSECMRREGPGRGAVCAAEQSGRSFGDAIASAGGVSERQRLEELDAMIRENCFSN